MKGHEPGRINQAARQGQMQADFLILLVNRTNSVILEDGRCRWLQIALLYERLRSAKVSEDEGKAVEEWSRGVREFATELFSIQTASELIQERYFDGECILLKDTLEGLEQQIGIVQQMVDAYDREAAETERPELVTNFSEFHNAVSQRASERADYIIALSKFKMLNDFGEDQAANTVLRPYIVKWYPSSTTPHGESTKATCQSGKDGRRS